MGGQRSFAATHRSDGAAPETAVRPTLTVRRKSTQTGHDRLGLFNYLVGAGEDRRRDYEFTAQPKLGNGRGALERWSRKQALTIGRGAGTEQRGEVGLSHVIERIADRNVCERHPPRHQEVTTLQPLLE